MIIISSLVFVFVISGFLVLSSVFGRFLKAFHRLVKSMLADQAGCNGVLVAAAGSPATTV